LSLRQCHGRIIPIPSHAGQQVVAKLKEQYEEE
jgi:hypothetical protein